MRTTALIVAAGRGTRAAATGIPKQYQMAGGVAVLRRTLDAFLGHGAVGSVLVVIGAEDHDAYENCAPPHKKLLPPVIGGDHRQASVLDGIRSLAGQMPDAILIHDAARPFVGQAVIGRVADALAANKAVVPVLPVASTLKSVAEGRVTGTVSRDGLFAAETPQGFDFATIRDAHERAAAAGMHFTDDAAVAEWAGVPVAAVAGDPANAKLTTAEDIAAADRRLTLEEMARLGDVRVGVGYDVHAFGPGAETILGGVAIPHTRGLVGHSDADVVLHALTDAVLGALGEGDIGEHFPPSDPRWKDASSDRFLAEAAARVKARGGVIAHLDVTYLGENPKVAPHRDAMRARIAAIAGVTADRVGVKATTNEGLGFIGRGEGAAAYAVATVRLPLK